MPAIVTILKGHTGLVKGVTWDPVGKYMASQSDDRSVRIWKTADWACQTTITEPFEECGGTTHILRLSWSPDGLYLVSAHAMNGGGPTAQIIEREGFKCDKDFVGHRKAVTCVVRAFFLLQSFKLTNSFFLALSQFHFTTTSTKDEQITAVLLLGHGLSRSFTVRLDDGPATSVGRRQRSIYRQYFGCVLEYGPQYYAGMQHRRNGGRLTI